MPSTEAAAMHEGHVRDIEEVFHPPVGGTGIASQWKSGGKARIIGDFKRRRRGWPSVAVKRTQTTPRCSTTSNDRAL